MGSLRYVFVVVVVILITGCAATGSSSHVPGILSRSCYSLTYGHPRVKSLLYQIVIVCFLEKTSWFLPRHKLADSRPFDPPNFLIGKG